jgi:predicted GIY-YIG superfamily endonuclease
MIGGRRVSARTIYLLHLDPPLGHGRHDLGSAGDLEERLREHASGHGARLTAVAHERGITWRMVRTWRGTRTDERRLKRRHNTPRLCPECRAHAGLPPHRPRGGAELVNAEGIQ